MGKFRLNNLATLLAVIFTSVLSPCCLAQPARNAILTNFVTVNFLSYLVDHRHKNT